MARLFFALWPDPLAAEALAALSLKLAEAAQGKPVPADKIHLTLAFLGELAPERARHAQEAGAALVASVFEMALDDVGSFRSARVAWAGASRTPPKLASLQRDLAEELRLRMFSPEDRPFVPHVTLARRISKSVARAQMPPIAWKARELTLVRSETGTGRYVVLERWPLRRA